MVAPYDQCRLQTQTPPALLAILAHHAHPQTYALRPNDSPNPNQAAQKNPQTQTANPNRASQRPPTPPILNPLLLPKNRRGHSIILKRPPPAPHPLNLDRYAPLALRSMHQPPRTDQLEPLPRIGDGLVPSEEVEGDAASCYEVFASSPLLCSRGEEEGRRSSRSD